MINAISGYNPSAYGIYGSYYANRAAQTLGANKAAQAAPRGVVTTARKVHQPEAPVQPVTPVRPVSREENPAQSGLLRFGSDPAEMAVRMRIQYPGDGAQQDNAAGAERGPAPGLPGTKDEAALAPTLPGAKEEAAPAPTLPGAKEEAAPALTLPGAKKDGDDSAQQMENPVLSESKSAQEVMEEGECQTCKERKYQDGSDDPGVSFKTPTNIAPEQAASAVRGHENEHVVREQAKARREDRKVVSQSVTYHTAICPECGKVYVSGGSTRTVTRAANSQQAEQQNQNQSQQNPRVATFALS